MSDSRNDLGCHNNEGSSFNDVNRSRRHCCKRMSQDSNKGLHHKQQNLQDSMTRVTLAPNRPGAPAAVVIFIVNCTVQVHCATRTNLAQQRLQFKR